MSDQEPDAVDWNDVDNVRVINTNGGILVPDQFTLSQPSEEVEEPEEEPKPPKPVLYQVGPDAIDEEYVTRPYRWVVYWYECGQWDGDGDAISYDGESLRSHNLSHCSCYSPEDGLNKGDVVTVEDLTSTSVLDNYRQDIVEKVLELLGVSDDG